MGKEITLEEIRRREKLQAILERENAKDAVQVRWPVPLWQHPSPRARA